MQVFQCLLETCERKFATAAERKRHLIDAHAFPKGFRFDSVHMRRHKGQVTTTTISPLPPGALYIADTGRVVVYGCQGVPAVAFV
jgi:hypothetical protein